MKKILVTGANGQLGSEIREGSLQLTNFQFVFTDIAELDITDEESIYKFVEDNEIDIIINCAAYTNVDKAETDGVWADLINNKAVEYLANASKRYNVSLIHISTDYVFDGSRNTPYSENMATHPLGVYGHTKREGEKAIEKSGCEFIILRTSWLYSSFANNFVKTMIRLTDEKDELKVVFDQVGTPTYAADLASFILYVIKTEQYINKKELYHFSNEGVCSWFDFAIEISKQVGTVCDITPCRSNEFPSIVTRPSYSVLDKTKLKKDFNYRIAYWKDSLMHCIKKLSENNKN